MRISGSSFTYERHSLRHPVGFKGRLTRELWQSVVSLRAADGSGSYGTGVQSVLWSDAEVFAAHDETLVNAMMLLATGHAAGLAVGLEWDDPLALLDRLLAPVHEHARRIACRSSLRPTFTLNALVPLDVAAWILFARSRGGRDFDGLVPKRFRPLLGHRHRELAQIPLISYAIPLDEVEGLLRQGHGILKIKIGNDPGGDGDRARMLDWDRRRLEEIHRLAERFETPYTDSGRVLYYLDANGRYDSLERVQELLGHARAIGALGRIALFEEPFPEEAHLQVGDLGVRIVADESAHGPADVAERIRLGYGAIALKPVAKTPSMSLLMLAEAASRGVPCFCADLTVDPLLREWNKNFAARIAPVPGMRVGMVESNGAQNYATWQALVARHPHARAAWLEPAGGAFRLDQDFYATGGGVLASATTYPGPGLPW